ncbi:hypothetical protein EYF80_042499 [Liparis tanakae]|uniref:Uncharacterized protein n=1 Tax=Liparis tanakae TaxID=230148 RepID=A0A4Z2G1D0_9TELE|nr:hypothetical protein EYF80_042499 [Liparis tanakae]
MFVGVAPISSWSLMMSSVGPVMRDVPVSTTAWQPQGHRVTAPCTATLKDTQGHLEHHLNHLNPIGTTWNHQTSSSLQRTHRSTRRCYLLRKKEKIGSSTTFCAIMLSKTGFPRISARDGYPKPRTPSNFDLTNTEPGSYQDRRALRVHQGYHSYLQGLPGHDAQQVSRPVVDPKRPTVMAERRGVKGLELPADGTQRSEEPVSKTTEKFCSGDPKEISP